MKKLRKRFLSCPKTSFFLFGPRGTGKSTWLQHCFQEALYLDLLSDDLSRQLLARPERLKELVEARTDRKVVIIDEIQRNPPLLSTVHQLIERHKAIQFVLTGSSARKLRREGVDLLAGRAVMTSCHPFMAAEIKDVFSLDKALVHGMVPVVAMADDPQHVLRTYINLYLKEEVQAEGLVRNLASFVRFLEAASFSHASVLNMNAVSRECEISRMTVEGYFSILNDLLIAVRIPVFSKRAKRMLVQHEKFYFFDAGVFRAFRPTGPLDQPQEIDGAALEGLVLQHLRSWNDYSGSPCTLHYWRTRAGAEVDFVLYGKDTFIAVEVKNADRIHTVDMKGLKAFGEDYPEARRLLLYRGTHERLIDGVLCLPCERFLKELVPNHPIPFAT